MCFINQNLSPGVAPPHLLRSEMPRLFFSFCSMPFLIMSHKPSEVETEHLKLTTASAKPKIGHFEIAEKTFCLFFCCRCRHRCRRRRHRCRRRRRWRRQQIITFLKKRWKPSVAVFDLSNVIQISDAAACLCSIDCKGLTNC